MITFSNVTVAFGDFVALPDFSLTIHSGEFFTFLGPSGCGKTTALRTLAGLNPTRSGSITINGHDVTHTSCDKRGIGMVFQNYALFPSMTVAANIGFGLKQQKKSASEISSAVKEIARVVDLSPTQLSKTVSQLSGGQQQRVAIARALVTKPDILLLDEPLSNLDAKLREQLRIQLKDLQKELKVTTIYVTHDQEEALCLSDRIAVLRAGRIEMVGTPTEVYEHSRTEFCCTFIGRSNKLGAQLARAVSDVTPAQLAATDAHYLRVEKVQILAPTDPGGPDVAAIDATVKDRSYYGLTSFYRIQALDTELTVALPEDGRNHLQPGTTVRVGIPIDKIMSYPTAGDHNA